MWSKLLDIGLFAITPGTVVVVGWAVWRDLKRDIADGKVERDAMKADIMELSQTIKDNGFVKRHDMEEAWRVADEIHKRQDQRMDAAERDIEWLRGRMDARG